MSRTLSARRPKTAGATSPKAGPFDMAAHRQAFGEFWGAVGHEIGRAIREGRA